MTRVTKAMATGWLLLCVGLCGGCEDKPVCTGGIGESGDCVDAGVGGDAGADGDADADADADTDADGDADRYAAIEAAYEAERVADDVPGLAVAIVENGELAWSQEFGTKGRDSDEAVTPTTRFRALIFVPTALALLQLVDAGLVERDVPVTRYLPDFTVSGEGPLEAEQASLVEQITIFDLLAGASGLEGGHLEPTEWPDHGDSVLGEYLTSPEFASTHHMVAPPGEVTFESTLAIVLMGLVVERVARQSGLLSQDEWFADYMRRYVFDPLGMVHTTYRAEEVEAAGDFAEGSELPAAPTGDENPWMRPAYGPWTTACDLALLTRFLLRGNDAVLSQALLDEALSPVSTQPAGYRVHGNLLSLATTDGLCLIEGICPAVGDLREHLAWGYYRGQWLYAFEVIPSRDLAVVFVSNGVSRFPDANQLALTELLDLPALAPDYPADDHDPAVYVGRYVLDSGGTTRVSLREDGTLHLSSPLCDLEPRGSGSFWCSRARDWVRFAFDADGAVEYLVTASWLAAPDPSDGQ